jgi:hypothetical protein
MLAILGINKEDIKAVDFTSSNINTFSITNSTRQDLKTAVFYNIDLRSGTNTNSLDWLSAKIVSSSGNSVTNKIGVTTYDQISNDPIGILFIEDPSSEGTIVKDKSILNTPKTELLNGVNKIFHQSIMDLKDITQIEKVDLNYDFNKNGYFDYYSSAGIEQKEYRIITNYIESIPNRNNLTYLFFISNLHTNYLLWTDAKKGSKEIDIIDSSIPIYYLEKGQIYTIGYGDKQQLIEIMDEPINLHVPGLFRVVRLKIDKPLKYDYTTDDAIWDEKLGLAFTNNLIAITPRGGNPILTMAHELLHLSRFGGLNDVGVNDIQDKDNVMLFHSTQDNTNDKLKYRSIKTVITSSEKPDGQTNMQWNKIHHITVMP